MDENVTAIIPAFNESKNVAETIAALKQIDGINEFIAIDDGSNDNTYEVLKSIDNIKIIHNEVNRGKGYAIKTALPNVSNKYILMVDADLRSSALEMKKLVENTKRNSKSMLIAVYPKPVRKGGFGLVKGLSRKGLYLLTSKSSESVLSGQRLIGIDFIRSIKLPDNFGLEFKITLEALRNDIDIIDVPLKIRHRETGRNIRGFVHRGKQFANILNVIIKELIK